MSDDKTKKGGNGHVPQKPTKVPTLNPQVRRDYLKKLAEILKKNEEKKKKGGG